MINKITVQFSLWYEMVRTIDTVFIILLVLKLFKVQPVVAVSWIWITAPIWIPLSLIVLILAVCYVPMMVEAVAGWFREKLGKERKSW